MDLSYTNFQNISRKRDDKLARKAEAHLMAQRRNSNASVQLEGLASALNNAFNQAGVLPCKPLEFNQDENRIDDQSFSTEISQQMPLTSSQNDQSAGQTECDMQRRIKLDREYFSKLEDGKRYRKNKNQIKRLKEIYAQDPVWDYSKKITIAEELGMTLQQVSKWNWDHRKKNGVSTIRNR